MKPRLGLLLEIPAALAMLAVALVIWDTSPILGVGFFLGFFYFLSGLFPTHITGDDEK